MEKKSRLYNSTRNVIFGLGNQVLITLLNFISRILFIKILGEEYLGINGLFSNILTVLSLADLGIGNAITYSMYKPLAEGNKKKISALMNFYRKVYNIIAIAIAVIGLSMLPFLDKLVKTTEPIPYLKIYFLLFLADSVVSYLLANRSAILTADQKLYITKIYNLIFSIIKIIIQIIVLIVTHNFILYLVVQVLSTFATNLCGAIVTKRLYPYLNKKEELRKVEKKSIFDNIKSIFLYRIGGVILNNTDNILISVIINTVTVGYYSNYTMIINSVNTFTSTIFNAINSSVGNLNTEKDKNKQLKIFYVINFICNWLFGFCTVCLLILLKDFITLAFGVNYVLDYLTTIIIGVNFWMPGILNAIALYRDTTGLFKETKYIIIITAILNIIFSIILGKIWGLFGILAATAISRILTNFWYEPYILFNKYFKTSVINYAKREIKYLMILIISYALIELICINMRNVGYLEFVIKMILCVIIPNVLYWFGNNKTEEFKYIQENVFNKYFNKIKKKLLNK